MKFWVLCLIATGLCAGQTATKLDEVAHTASIMVDGDACQRIVTERALSYIVKKDPRDPYLGADNYDVHHEAFIATKKTLIRLSRLVDFPTDVNLWMPLPGVKGQVHVVIRNVNEMSQFWRFGALHQDMPPAMRRVLETGERVTVADSPGIISVLAPVHNSLDEIVGLVEVVTRTKPAPRENVK